MQSRLESMPAVAEYLPAAQFLHWPASVRCAWSPYLPVGQFGQLSPLLYVPILQPPLHCEVEIAATVAVSCPFGQSMHDACAA